MIESRILPASHSNVDASLNVPLFTRHSTSGNTLLTTSNRASLSELNQPPTFLYLLEYCPNVGVITFTLSLNGHSKNDSNENGHWNDQSVLSLFTITSESISFSDNTIRFPVPVDPRSMREKWNGLDLSLRFHKKHVPSSLRSSRMLRSTEIEPTRFWYLPWISNATSIACIQCKKSISSPSSTQLCSSVPNDSNTKLFKRSFLAPASHWQELVECWACHEQSIVMPHIHSQKKFNSEVCGVGPSFLLVSSELGTHWNTTLIPMDHRTRIQCRSCDQELGEVTQQGETYIWKLYKVRLLVYQQDQVWNSTKLVYACLAAELMELHHSFACLPSSSSFSNVQLCLWVLNWNTVVKMKDVASPQSVKLLYRSVEKMEPHLPVLLHFDVPSLWESLQILTSQLPLTRRTVILKEIEWNVAYLMV